ncbi:LamG domain-containing protein [Streptomyces sp. NBC_00589]|nr:LamG domain-containing protein [Streptomyces sp. NBC_00775]WUB32067.1 LamG domain-containing protein [Streptomyces sp. NBC_00589]
MYPPLDRRGSLPVDDFRVYGKTLTAAEVAAPTE